MDGIFNRRGQLQRGKGRRDSWTKEKRKTFLDVLAATGGVREAERAAGAARGAARNLRRKDATFGRQWDEALEQAYRRLEDELVAYALGHQVSPDDPGDEREEPAPEHRCPFDPDLALRVLAMRHRKPKRAVVPKAREMDPAELEQALLRKLGDLAASLAEHA